MRTVLLVACLAAAAGCTSVAPSATTGLTGIVTRGPVTPVCRIDIPCDAPFSAGFSVEQGGKRVAEFRSDADGHFTVWLEPGTYRVVPASDAPVLGATSQAKVVDVGAVGLTSVHLEFDTGIR